MAESDDDGLKRLHPTDVLALASLSAFSDIDGPVLYDEIDPAAARRHKLAACMILVHLMTDGTDPVGFARSAETCGLLDVALGFTRTGESAWYVRMFAENDPPTLEELHELIPIGNRPPVTGLTEPGDTRLIRYALQVCVGLAGTMDIEYVVAGIAIECACCGYKLDELGDGIPEQDTSRLDDVLKALVAMFKAMRPDLGIDEDFDVTKSSLPISSRIMLVPVQRYDVLNGGTGDNVGPYIISN